MRSWSLRLARGLGIDFRDKCGDAGQTVDSLSRDQLTRAEFVVDLGLSETLMTEYAFVEGLQLFVAEPRSFLQLPELVQVALEFSSSSIPPALSLLCDGGKLTPLDFSQSAQEFQRSHLTALAHRREEHRQLNGISVSRDLEKGCLFLSI